MLADIFLGYAHYAPGTLVIKGVMALVAALMYEKMGRTATSRIAGGVVSEIIMVLGYFGYASLLLGKGLAAAASIPATSSRVRSASWSACCWSRCLSAPR